jgi:hypothetical protein
MITPIARIATYITTGAMTTVQRVHRSGLLPEALRAERQSAGLPEA